MLPYPGNMDWMISSLFGINATSLLSLTDSPPLSDTPAYSLPLYGVLLFWLFSFLFHSVSLPFLISVFDSLMLFFLHVFTWRDLRCPEWDEWQFHGQHRLGWQRHCLQSPMCHSFFLSLFDFNVYSLICGPQVHRIGLAVICASHSLNTSPWGSLLLINSSYSWFALGFI